MTKSLLRAPLFGQMLTVVLVALCCLTVGDLLWSLRKLWAEPLRLPAGALRGSPLEVRKAESRLMFLHG